MLDGATTGDVCRAGRIVQGCFARLLAFLNYELDNLLNVRGLENSIQLLLGRMTQDALLALVGEKYLERYKPRSNLRYLECSKEHILQSTTIARGIVLIG
jgi:hypothetical protein